MLTKGFAIRSTSPFSNQGLPPGTPTPVYFSGLQGWTGRSYERVLQYGPQGQASNLISTCLLQLTLPCILSLNLFYSSRRPAIQHTLPRNFHITAMPPRPWVFAKSKKRAKGKAKGKGKGTRKPPAPKLAGNAEFNKFRDFGLLVKSLDLADVAAIVGSSAELQAFRCTIPKYAG